MTDGGRLTPELRRLFDETPRLDPPEGAEERAFDRLATAIVATGTPLPLHATKAGPPASRRLPRSLVLLVAATFIAGAAAGATAVATLAPAPPPRIVYIPAAPPSVPTGVPRVAALPSSEVPSVLASDLPDRPAAPAAGIRRPPAASQDPATALSAERALLEDARTRLVAGDAEGTLARLDEHAQRYPSGHFAEEREALAIQALVNRRQFDEARARGTQFQKQWPRSVYLSSVDATLGSIP